MKGKYKRSATYCFNCDMAIVAIGKKCPKCNVRMIGPKLKKPSKHELLKEMGTDEPH